MRPLSLYAWQYDVEKGYDYLTVGSIQFKGSLGPNGVKMSVGEAMLWKSDGDWVKEGWKVCTMKGPGGFAFNADANQQTNSQSLMLTLSG